MDNGVNKVIELTPTQLSPGMASPWDFKIRTKDDELAEEFGGQCGDTEAEYKELLKIRELGRPTQKHNIDVRNEHEMNQKAK